MGNLLWSISLKQCVNSFTHDIKLRTKEPVYKQASIALNKEDSFKEDFPKETVDPFGNLTDRKDLVVSLGFEIIYRMNDKLVVMPTALVAAVVLMNRNGISEDTLVERVEWLGHELVLRKSKLGLLNENSTSFAIRNAINHLEGIISKTKRNIFELSVSPKVDYKNILLLSYYRNTLLHIFAMEALVECSMSTFGHQLAFKEGVSNETL